MSRKSFIALHRREWDRLHRKADDGNKLTDERDAYFKKLVEISQAWVKTWPDTVQGHMEKIKKEIKKHHKDEIDLVKSFLNNKKKENTAEAIKKAKDLIFENSCYGKQLTSALLESKVLEERALQIELKKELKQMVQDQEKEALSKVNFKRCSFNLDKNQDDDKRKKREKEIELAQINKSMYEMEICKRNKEKKEQEKLDLENALLMQTLLENEARQEKAYEKLLRKDFKLYEKEQKKARERKIKREKREEAIAEAQRKEIDKRQCKIRRVMNELHHNNHNTERNKQNYELIKELQEKEQARYNNFVQTGVKKFENRALQTDQEETLKKNAECHKRKLIAQFNKKEADKAIESRNISKQNQCCYTDRQSIMTKSSYNPKKCTKRDKESAIGEKQPLNFLVPAKKFQEQLEARKKEPSPWTGLTATHAHFAEQAGRTLQEAKHKRFARKVVDQYRKTNCLDATTLPVANYD